ncbi:MAG: transporter, partial [Pseudomonas sp.]
MPFFTRSAVLTASLLSICAPAFADPVQDARLE